MELKERGLSLGSESSQATTRAGLRSHRPSVSSSVTNRTRKSSRLEVVEMPGGAMLLEVEEDQLDVVSLGRRDSLGGAVTVAGIPTALVSDTKHIDEKIKLEIAHHSPEVGASKEEEESDGEEEEGLHKEEPNDNPQLALGASNLLYHLFLALASPAFFRIPALAYKWSSPSGSGFFPAYLVVVVVLALPLSVLEHTLAQFSSLGPTTLFPRCLPLLAGVGVGMVVTCGLLTAYTSTVLAWGLRYTFDSLQADLPWVACDNSSGTAAAEGCGSLYTPNEYYFLTSVLGASGVGGVTQDWSISLSLTVTQLFVWLALLLTLWRGDAWRAGVLNKLAAVTTTTVLLVLMVSGLGLSHSGSSLGTVLVWSSRDLGHPDIWLDAFGQAVWSLGPTLGLLITRCSYRRFRAKIRVDVYSAVAANVLVAFLLILALFSFHTEAVDKTPGFFFILSSRAVQELAVPQVGAALLYLGLCKALLDHTQMLASCLAVGVADLLPVRWLGRRHRLIVALFLCCFSFLASIPFVANEGIYLVRAVDTYLPWVAGLALGTVETAALIYLYGAASISLHFKMMLHHEITIFVFVWKFVLVPAFLALDVWACVVGVDGPATWQDLQLGEEREEGYRVAGMVLALTPPLLAAVISFLVAVTHARSPVVLVRPRPIWGPALAQHQALYSPGVLRVKAATPRLMVLMSVEDLDEPGKDWLPYGFFCVSSQLSSATALDIDTFTRFRIAKFLQSQLSVEGGGYLDDDADGLQSSTALRQPLSGEAHLLDVSKFVLGNHARTTSSASSFSSGVLLRPASLPPPEANSPGTPALNAFDNPSFEK